MKTPEGAAVTVARSVDPDQWRCGFDAVLDRIAPRFARHEPLRHAGALMLGMISDLGRKNCWTIAERSGHATPDRLQHLLSRAVWDADAVRDDLRGYVVEHLGNEDAILVVDETGDLKKGAETVGVQRQYTGTAGRIENSQVAVYLAYASSGGHALIDRALYLPKSWIDDAVRREKAGVPEDTGFTTKPVLAAQMIVAALEGGVHASWVAGDEVYGADPTLREKLEDRGVGYVLAVGCNRRVITSGGNARVDDLAVALPADRWQRHSAGAGSKGPRWYSWARIRITEPGDGHRHVLVRRNDTTGEIAYYRCYSAAPVSLTTLVRVAGQRWKVEESFQATKELAGLDEHQVRRWTSWHRWVTLAMLAHAFLTVTTAAQRAAVKTAHDLIALTVNEFRRLFEALLLRPSHTTSTVLEWSLWRRRHQARAHTSHHNKRLHHH